MKLFRSKKKKNPNKQWNRLILLAAMPLAYGASVMKIADAVRRASGKEKD